MPATADEPNRITSDVFISYSRTDRDFVKKIHAALEEAGRTPWVDWTGIPPTATFMQKIYEAIEATDHFVFVLSPDSIKSDVCRVELDHAIELQKRLLPVVHRDVLPQETPKALAEINWLFFRQEDDFQAAFQQLIAAIDLDLEWVRMHTRLLVRASEWKRNEYDDSFLLRGVDLKRAANWLPNSDDQRRPTPLQREYVEASEVWESQEIERLNQALEEAKEQRRVAESEKRNAREQLAVSLLSQGDALGRLYRWPESVELYLRAQAVLRDLGKSIAFANIPLWNAICHSPPALCTFAPHQDNILCAVFSPEEGVVISASRDGTIKYWDYFGNVEKRPAIRPDGGITSARIYKDLSLALTLSEDRRKVELWDIADGNALAKWETEDSVTAFALSPEQDATLFVFEGGRLELRKRNDGETLWTTPASKSLIKTITFSPCGNYIISGSMGLACAGNSLNLAGGVVEPTLRLWDRDTGRLIHDFGDHRLPVDDVLFVDRISMITVCTRQDGGMHGVLTLWDYKSGTRLRSIDQEVFGLRSASIAPDGKSVVSAGGRDDTLIQWDIESGKKTRLYDSAPCKVDGASFSADGEFLLGIGDYRQIKVWPSKSSEEDRILGERLGCVRRVAFSPDGRFASGGAALSLVDSMASAEMQFALAQGKVRCPIKIWDSDSGCLVFDLEGHASSVTSISFSTDSCRLLSSGADHKLKVWDVATGSLVRSIELGNRWAAATVFQANSSMAFVGFRDGFIELWDVDNARLVGEVDAHSALVDALYLVDNGTRLISAGRDGRLKFWEAETGSLLGELSFPEGVCPMAVSGNGSSGVSGDYKGILHFWNPKNQSIVRTIQGHSSHINGVAMSPDGQIAASGGGDALLKLWDVASGRELLAFSGYGGPVYSVVFSADGLRLLSGSDDQTIRLWDFSRPERYAVLQGQLARNSNELGSCENAEWLATWGEWLLFRGYPKPALSHLERANHMVPNTVSVLALGRCHWRAGSRTIAREYFSKAAGENKDSIQFSEAFVHSLSSEGESRRDEDQEAAGSIIACPRCGRGNLDQRSEPCAVCGTDIRKWLAAQALVVMEPLLDFDGVLFEKTTTNVEAKDSESHESSSSGISERRIPGRPLVYMFQHVALPKATFENHPELMRELSEPRSHLALLHFRSKAHLLCIDAGWFDVDYLDDDSALEEEMQLFDAVKIQPYQKDGYTAHIVTMPPPEFNGEAHMIAIVYKDSEPKQYMHPAQSTRYFTLEKTQITSGPLLCEWFVDGTRDNYGEGPDPVPKRFADAVFARILSDAT